MKSLSKAPLIVQTCQPYSGRMFQMCLEMQLQFNDFHIGRMQIYLFPVIDMNAVIYLDIQSTPTAVLDSKALWCLHSQLMQITETWPSACSEVIQLGYRLEME